MFQLGAAPFFAFKSAAYIFLNSSLFKFFLLATRSSVTNFYTPESTLTRYSDMASKQSIAYSSLMTPNYPRINLKVSTEAVTAGPRSLSKSAFLRTTGGGRYTTGASPAKNCQSPAK